MVAGPPGNHELFFGKISVRYSAALASVRLASPEARQTPNCARCCARCVGLLPTLPLVCQRSESPLRRGTADAPLLGRPVNRRVLPTPIGWLLPSLGAV